MHPQEVRALRHNQEVLVTPYDLHHTIKDIVAAPARVPPLPNFDYSLSMLDPIDPSRTCDQAGILGTLYENGRHSTH